MEQFIEDLTTQCKELDELLATKPQSLLTIGQIARESEYVPCEDPDIDLKCSGYVK